MLISISILLTAHPKIQKKMSPEVKIKINQRRKMCSKKILVKDLDLEQNSAKEMSKRARDHKRYKNALRNRSSGFFVRNLSSEVTKEKLKRLFSTCGDVTEVKILKTKHGNLAMSVCAFIKYATNEEALKAVKELGGKVFLQRSIQTEWPKKVPTKYLQENDYLPVTNSEEIQKLKETMEDLKQEKLKNNQMAKKLKFVQKDEDEEWIDIPSPTSEKVICFHENCVKIVKKADLQTLFPDKEIPTEIFQKKICHDCPLHHFL